MTESRIKPTSNKLNIGCGDHFHSEWCNVDVRASNPDVIEYDIRFGLPFDEASFDVVYHSHVLEHLTNLEGECLLHECLRVLRPGGVLRVVVPDLETIAALYLEKLRRADLQKEDSVADYSWMKLELLDQMVRDTSGGLMGRYMADPNIVNSDFVRSRIGNEFQRCQPRKAESHRAAPTTKRVEPRTAVRTTWMRVREKLARKSVRLFLGRSGETALLTGLFRNQGEVHRWMYDRFSMNQICTRLGFVHFRICGPQSSAIPNFAAYQLDTIEGAVRKPDSLFIECTKPMAVVKAA